MYYDTKISPYMHEQKLQTCDWVLKSLDESGVFAGYASVFSVIDQQQDMVLPGAFQQTLAKRSGAVKLLWQHDVKEPIGTIEELREDENGLYIKGWLLLEVARAKEAYTLLMKGVLSGLSIGYSPVRYSVDPETGVRLLKEVELWEVSLVTFPANSAARITVVKSDEDMTDESEMDPIQAVRLMEALEYATRALRQLI